MRARVMETDSRTPLSREDVIRLVRETAVRAIVSRYEHGLRAIVLTGSMARHEATIVPEGDGWRVIGDADLFAVFGGRRELPSDGGVEHLARSIESVLRANGVRLRIGLASVTTGYFAALPRHIATYELRTCGRVLWGDAGILEIIPEFAPAEISREDAWRMLGNRIIELLEAVAAGSSEQSYRTVKLYLDMATSYLVFAGRYEPTYLGRARAVSAVIAAGAQLPGAPFPMEQFTERVAACTAVKLEGTAPVECSEEALFIARALWQWELGLLTSVSRATDGWELMRIWMERQPRHARLRGWASVLRRSGWLRGIRHWPRWARLGITASPRYWVYAVATGLCSGSAELSAASALQISDVLPETASRPTGDMSAWQWLAAETASNYRRFLEKTSA